MTLAKRLKIALLLSINLWLSTLVGAHADSIFVEDFADEDLNDDDPVTWIPGSSDRLEVDLLGLMMSTAHDGFVRASVTGLDLQDSSVRTRLGVTEGEVIGIASRWANGTNYYGFYSHIPNGIGIGGTQTILANGPSQIIDLSDINLQLDVIGNQIDFWAWPANEMMPVEPLVSAEHDDLTAGDFYIWAQSDASFQADGPVSVTIRYVDVADSHITTGDFNNDGTLDADDIDTLSAAAVALHNSLRFDLDGDGAFDKSDHHYWVSELKNTYFGDSNLDGEFNSADFVQVFQAGQYEDNETGNSSWATGDWNGDQEFDSADFVLAFQEGGYEKGPRNVVAVPETASGPLFVALATLLAASSLRRRPSR